MSMIGHMRKLSPAEYKQVKCEPGFTRQLTGLQKAVDNMAANLARMKRVQELGFKAQTGDQAARAEMMKILAEVAGQRDPGLRLEKSWHVLHFVLCGSGEPDGTPLSNAILGGTEIGEDVGYGPARLLSAEQVKATAEALKAVAIEKAAARYREADAAQKQIYCPNHEAEEIVYFFQQLRDYYEAAAREDSAMLLWVN